MTTKKKTSNSNSKNVLYPILLLFLAVVAVILIIVLTQGSKPATPEASTEAALTEAVSAAETNNEMPELVGTKQYSGEPAMLIDTSKKYNAVVKMEKGGEFVIELYADKAPITVNSFVFLARQGYFDGITFHRVLPGFMAQTGDPTGTGYGGPGYEFIYEPNEYKFDKAGVVAMANSGPASATNGSQFFITFDEASYLDGGYTIFGQVTEGMDVVNNITLRDPEQSPDYTGDVISSITINEE